MKASIHLLEVGGFQPDYHLLLIESSRIGLATAECTPCPRSHYSIPRRSTKHKLNLASIYCTYVHRSVRTVWRVVYRTGFMDCRYEKSLLGSYSTH